MPMQRTEAASELTVYIESITASVGQQVVVPVKLANVPSSGISAADLSIVYDASKLEYISGTPGDIITDPATNFEINKDKDGSLKMIFLDYTVSNGYIKKDGVFANLTFRVLGTTTITISKANFGDPSFKPIAKSLNAGTITVNAGGSTPPVTSGLTAYIESITASVGQQVVVPVKLANVPSGGIIAADMSIIYDANKLEYISGAPGNIIADPDTNFEINKDKEGSIKILFLDYTLSNGYIKKDGVFANVTFRVLGTSTITINKANFGDPNFTHIAKNLIDGTITVTGTNPTQPVTPTPIATPTPIPTITPIPSQPPTQSGSFSVKYTQSDWGTGATVTVTITNEGNTAKDGWTVSFDFTGNQKITNAWNCTYSQSGKSVLMSNVDYNRIIPAGGSVTIGFNISYSGANSIPTNITVK